MSDETRPAAKSSKASGKSGMKVESVKIASKRVKAGVAGKTFFTLLAMLMHLPSAYTEEASILENASVSQDNLDDSPFIQSGNNLIGKGFKNYV